MELGLELFALLIAVAAMAGIVDAIAGGGGLLTVPALIACGVPPVAALATNKVHAVFGTASACWAFARAGHIDVRAMLLPAIAAFAGSIGGATVVQHVDPSLLAGLVPLLLIIIAGYFLLSPAMSEIDGHRWMNPGSYAVVAAAVGFYDGFFGPGAGSFYAASLIALMGLGVVRATGHTKMLNLASNLAAVLVFSAAGQVVWPLGLAMAVASTIGAQIGSRVAMRFGVRLIKPLLVVMSLALTARMLADPANPLAQLLWG